MIRKKQTAEYPIVIDLTGPDGNAWNLLGYAKQMAVALDKDYNQIRDEMISSDYENLIQVFDKYFGEYVILER